MAIFSIGVAIFATAYIRADTEEEALEIAKSLKGEELNMRTGVVGDLGGEEIAITGEQFGPDMADVTLSPAMTCDGPGDEATTAALDCVDPEDKTQES